MVNSSECGHVGNAYYLRTVHADVRPEWRRLLVITSQFQMARTQAGIKSGNQHLRNRSLPMFSIKKKGRESKAGIDT